MPIKRPSIAVSVPRSCCPWRTDTLPARWHASWEPAASRSDAGAATGWHGKTALCESSSKTPRVLEPPPLAARSSGVKAWRWRVRPRRTLSVLAATGRRAKWPPQPSNAGWSAPFPRVTSGVFYNQVDLKPPQSRYGLHRAPEAAADEQRADGSALYRQAPPLHAAGERVLATAEMTGIQALERKQPTIPLGPGRVERREFAYIRHGTLTLIANFDVAQGHVGAPSSGPTRTAEDFVAPLARTVASDPKATRWHFVPDNLTMHQAESLVRWVAEPDGLQDDLGQKDKPGLLQSMATRAAFRADPMPGLGFHYPPQQASWMHQIERWCSMLVRKLLKRASFASVAELQAKVVALIAYCNATMAKPFTWTYGRKPLSV